MRSVVQEFKVEFAIATMNSTEGDSPSVTGECPHYNRGCSLVVCLLQL